MIPLSGIYTYAGLLQHWDYGYKNLAFGNKCIFLNPGVKSVESFLKGT